MVLLLVLSASLFLSHAAFSIYLLDAAARSFLGRPRCCRYVPSASQQLLLAPGSHLWWLLQQFSLLSSFPLASLLLFCDSASSIPFVRKGDRKQSVPSAYPQLSIWSFSFSRIALCSTNSVTMLCNGARALGKTGFGPLREVLTISSSVLNNCSIEHQPPRLLKCLRFGIQTAKSALGNVSHKTDSVWLQIQQITAGKHKCFSHLLLALLILYCKQRQIWGSSLNWSPFLKYSKY